MEYYSAIEVRDYAKIDKLNELTDLETYWKDVSKLTARVHSDHSLARWQVLAEIRRGELVRERIGKNDVTPLLMLFDRTIANCLFYEKENKPNCLLNEIGVLRGVDCALCELGYFYHRTHKDFGRLITIQNKATLEERAR